MKGLTRIFINDSGELIWVDYYPEDDFIHECTYCYVLNAVNIDKNGNPYLDEVDEYIHYRLDYNIYNPK